MLKNPKSFYVFNAHFFLNYIFAHTMLFLCMIPPLLWNKSTLITENAENDQRTHYWINSYGTNQPKHESCPLLSLPGKSPARLFPSFPCKSQCVFLRGVYRLGIMKSLRESEVAGVNTRQGILSISSSWAVLFRAPFFLRLSPWIIKMLSHIKKYNAVYGRTINTASKLITFLLRRIIYFAALGPRRSHSPLLLSHLVDEWAM